MALYNLASVRDEALITLDRLQRESERKLSVEIDECTHQFGYSASNAELKMMWSMEAKVEAQFAYMRRLMRTQGFVTRTMTDFDGLDTKGSNGLDAKMLQVFVQKRDGASTDFAAIEKRTEELLKELDIDGDGVVSRTEWLIYLSFLHWQSFLDDCVVEKIIEVTKEYKNDKKGTPVCVESITQHPPIARSQRLATMGARISTENFGRGAASPLSPPVNSSSVGSRNKVERVHQKSDGTFETTIEHRDLPNNAVNGIGLTKCGCF